MKILILGGHGFVGKNVYEMLDSSKHRVYNYSRYDGLDLLYPNITQKYFIEIDPDVIINCAADVGSLNYVTRRAAEVLDNNMNMLLNIYSVVQKVVPNAIIINPVANCAYPGDLDFYTEDKFWSGAIHKSVLAYGSTRRMMLVLSECYRNQYNVRSINYFVPNMYGPYDSSDPDKAHALNALISKVIKAKKENKKQLEVWGTGEVIREWLFAKDYAKILRDTIEDIGNKTYDEPVNIGQNFGLSVKELVDLIINETKFEGEIIWNRSMPDGAPKKVMDNKKFQKTFPLFKFTDFKEGIRETINYYKSIYPY